MSSSKRTSGPPKGGWVVPWVIKPKNLFLIHGGVADAERGISAEILVLRQGVFPKISGGLSVVETLTLVLA